MPRPSLRPKPYIFEGKFRIEIKELNKPVYHRLQVPLSFEQPLRVKPERVIDKGTLTLYFVYFDERQAQELTRQAIQGLSGARSASLYPNLKEGYIDLGFEVYLKTREEALAVGMDIDTLDLLLSHIKRTNGESHFLIEEICHALRKYFENKNRAFRGFYVSCAKDGILKDILASLCEKEQWRCEVLEKRGMDVIDVIVHFDEQSIEPREESGKIGKVKGFLERVKGTAKVYLTRPLLEPHYSPNHDVFLVVLHPHSLSKEALTILGLDYLVTALNNIENDNEKGAVFLDSLFYKDHTEAERDLARPREGGKEKGNTPFFLEVLEDLRKKGYRVVYFYALDPEKGERPLISLLEEHSVPFKTLLHIRPAPPKEIRALDKDRVFPSQDGKRRALVRIYLEEWTLSRLLSN